MRVRQRDPDPVVSKVAGEFVLTRTGPRPKVIRGPVYETYSEGGIARQITFDEVHEGPPYRSGGPFFSVLVTNPSYLVKGYTVKGRPITSPTSVTGAFQPGDVWSREYSGGLLVSPGSLPAYLTALGHENAVNRPDQYHSVLNPDDLTSLGSRAWQKLRPKVERASLMQSIIELREAPRMYKQTAAMAASLYKQIARTKAIARYAADPLKGAREVNALVQFAESARDLRKVPKSISDEFLNVQFGWKPFVKDVNAICDVAVNFDEYTARAEKYNDVWQPVSYHEEVVETSDLVMLDGPGLVWPRVSPVLGDDYVVPWTSEFRIYRERCTRVWYKGSFKYYRPEFDKGLVGGYAAVRSARQALSLLGGNITPTVLYKVTPWTFLLDWFVNVGDNVQRFEDNVTGQVAARYFYLMRETYDRFRYVSSFTDRQGKVQSVEAVREVRVKRRAESTNPFEFSLLPANLSGMQLSILAALGISRM